MFSMEETIQGRHHYLVFLKASKITESLKESLTLSLKYSWTMAL